MFHGGHTIQKVCAAAALVVLAYGCDSSPPAAPNPGTLTVDVAPAASSQPGLVITGGHVQLFSVTVLGDVAPDGRSMFGETNIDLMGAGRAFVFSMLPQGVYSRVRFAVESVAVEGTWRGAPLALQLEFDDSAALIVDLRASADVDVTPGHDGAFQVAIDAGSWFAGAVLDGADASGGQILIDATHNVSLAQTIRSRLAGSFTLGPMPGPM